MKRKKKIIVWAIIIIVISNNYPIKAIIRMFERDAQMYSYSTIDDPQSIIFESGMNPNFWYFQVMKDSSWLKENPEFKDKYYKKLYRHFPINPLFFWHWWEYFFDERYKLPYISYGDVVKNWEREHGRKYVEGK